MIIENMLSQFIENNMFTLVPSSYVRSILLNTEIGASGTELKSLGKLRFMFGGAVEVSATLAIITSSTAPRIAYRVNGVTIGDIIVASTTSGYKTVKANVPVPINAEIEFFLQTGYCNLLTINFDKNEPKRGVDFEVL